jgi:hypothetical protein
VHACIQSGLAVLYIGSASSDVHALCAERLRAPYFRVEMNNAEGCWEALENLTQLLTKRDDGDRPPKAARRVSGVSTGG